jgi:hypothetical protein
MQTGVLLFRKNGVYFMISSFCGLVSNMPNFTCHASQRQSRVHGLVTYYYMVWSLKDVCLLIDKCMPQARWTQIAVQKTWPLRHEKTEGMRVRWQLANGLWQAEYLCMGDG